MGITLRWGRRGVCTLFLGMLAGAAAAEHSVHLQFEFREPGATITLSDIQFVSAREGFLLGKIQRGGREDPVLVRTRDGGSSWQMVAAPEAGKGLWFIDARRGWYATEWGIFHSDDGGDSWTNQGGPRGMERVLFLNRERGFAVGSRKRVYETEDGGENWKPVAAAAAPESTPQRTVYGWVDFADQKNGLISGWSVPVRLEERATRRQWPTLSILLDTRDGGVTWRHSTSSMFGQITRVRLGAGGVGLGLIEFLDWFEWPAEVFRIDWRSGKSERVFRDKRVAVKDVAVVAGGGGWLAGIGTRGEPAEFHQPGPLKLFYSKDLVDWEEVPVGEGGRVGGRALLAVSPEGRVWVAVDRGAVYEVRKR